MSVDESSLRALDLLDEQGLGQSRTLMRLLSCLPDVPVPHRLLLIPELMVESELFWGLTGARLDHLVEGLSRLALIEVEAAGAGPAVVRLTPPIRRLLLDDTDRSGHRPACVVLWAELAYVGTSENITGLPDDPAVAAAWELLAPIAFHVFGMATAAPTADGIGAERIDHAANAALHAATHLASIGRFAEARDAAATVHSACHRILGPDHNRTLYALGFQASHTAYAGDIAAARQLLDDVLAGWVRRGGREHPDAVIAQHNVAFWAGEEGDAVAARDGFAVLADLRAAAGGDDHPDTLLARADLSFWTGKAGDAATAARICAEILPAAEQLWGPDAPETADIRKGLAHWTERIGTDDPSGG